MMSHAGTCCHDMCIIKAPSTISTQIQNFPLFFFHLFLVHIVLPLFIELDPLKRSRRPRIELQTCCPSRAESPR